MEIAQLEEVERRRNWKKMRVSSSFS